MSVRMILAAFCALMGILVALGTTHRKVRKKLRYVLSLVSVGCLVAGATLAFPKLVNEPNTTGWFIILAACLFLPAYIAIGVSWRRAFCRHRPSQPHE